jgi:hypothetical protein
MVSTIRKTHTVWENSRVYECLTWQHTEQTVKFNSIDKAGPYALWLLYSPVTRKQIKKFRFKNCSLFVNYTKLTPWKRVLLEKLIAPQLLTKFGAFYEARKFITVLKRAPNLSLSSARSVHSTSHPIS